MRLQVNTASGGQLFDAVDEAGRVVATGTLEVELVHGAQRHGSLQFVTEPGDNTDKGAHALAEAMAS
jgi:hypothetical protein